MGGDAGAVEPGSLGAGAEHPRRDVSGERLQGEDRVDRKG
jgi:hypothetical protein